MRFTKVKTEQIKSDYACNYIKSIMYYTTKYKIKSMRIQDY